MMMNINRKLSNWKYKFNLWKRNKKHYMDIFYCDEFLLRKRQREYSAGKIEIHDNVAFWVLENGLYPVADGVALSLEKLGLSVDLTKTNDYRQKNMKIQIN